MINKVRPTVRVVGVWSLRTCHLRVESAHANQHIKRQHKIDQREKTVLGYLQASYFRYRHFEHTSPWPWNRLKSQEYEAQPSGLPPVRKTAQLHVSCAQNEQCAAAPRLSKKVCPHPRLLVSHRCELLMPRPHDPHGQRTLISHMS